MCRQKVGDFKKTEAELVMLPSFPGSHVSLVLRRLVGSSTDRLRNNYSKTLLNLILIVLFSSQYQASSYVQVGACKKKTCWGQQIIFKDMIQIYKQKRTEKPLKFTQPLLTVSPLWLKL